MVKFVTFRTLFQTFYKFLEFFEMWQTWPTPMKNFQEDEEILCFPYKRNCNF